MSCYNSKLNINKTEDGYKVGMIVSLSKPIPNYKPYYLFLTNFKEESEAEEFIKQYNEIAYTSLANLYIQNYKRLGPKLLEYMNKYDVTDEVEKTIVCEADLERVKKQTEFAILRLEEAFLRGFNDFVIDTILLSYIGSGEEDEGYTENFQNFTTFDNFLCLVLIHFPEWLNYVMDDNHLTYESEDEN
jgi:hypothetical protein